MLTQDQLTTIRAALRYWRDEMTPSGSDVAAYYDISVEKSLQAGEIELLIEQLQPNKARCVLITPEELVLAVTKKPASNPGPNRNATLIYGPEFPERVKALS